MTAQLQGQAADDVCPAQVTTKGMAQGTQVLTAEGLLPVEFLAPGDRIITRDGLRVLVDVSMHVMVGDVVRISASSQGHARPEEDVVLGCDQALLIRDWRAKALYGAAQAVVPVERMIDGELVRRERASGLRMYRLEFASAAVVYAGGLELACDAVPVAA
jgi:Hint domain